VGFVEFVARDAPLPAVALGSVLALIAAREAGAILHRLLRRFADGPEHGGADEAYILSATLGLLALLVGFTFSLALDRFDTRRSLVVTEANALGTTYLRTDLLKAPASLRADLRAYAQQRVVFGLASGAAQQEAMVKADRLQSVVWRDAIAATEPLQGSSVTRMLLDPLNEAIDTAARRKAALAARLPTSVLMALGVYSLIAAGMLGYTVAAAGARHRVASILMFMLLALAITLILDLDRPRSGEIQVPQTAMIEAVAAMHP
jgi:hypothetical protein